MKRYPLLLLTILGICFFILPNLTQAANPSTTNLTAYWSFDEGTASTSSDSSGNAHTGSLNGNVSWGTGNIGTAVLFSSTTGQYINTGSDYIGTGDTTISGWIYPRSGGGSSIGRIIDNSQMIIRMGTSNRLSASSNGGTTTINSANSSVSYNTWTHFVVTRTSAGIINFYINGSLSGTADQNSGTPATTGTNVYIGNRASGSLTAAWDGYLDDMRVYSRILTGGEISDLYSATASYPDTVAPYRSGASPTNQLVEGTTQTTLSLTTSESATCKYGSTANTSYASIANTFSTTGGTTHSSTITGLTTGSYTYYVRCQDGTGNSNSSDYSISFSVAGPPPVISSISASTTPTTATINWVTDTSSDTQINYGTLISYGATTTLSSSLVTSHSQVITGLTPNTTYHFRVRSMDSGNNLGVSSDQTFTTQPALVYYVKGDSTVDYSTIQSCANAITSGQTCYVLAGNYDEYITIASSGTSGSRITFQGDATSTVTVKGFSLTGKDYNTIKKFTVTGNTSSNAFFIKSATSTQVLDNTIHDTSGICIRLHPTGPSNHTLIKNNNLSYCGSADASPSIGVQVEGAYNVVTDNTMHHLGDDATRVFGNYNIVRNNTFYDLDLYTNIWSGNVAHIDGIQTFCDTTSLLEMNHNLIENNYMYDSPDTNTHFSIFQHNDESCTGFHDVVIRGNKTHHLGSFFVLGNNTFEKIRVYNNTITDGNISSTPKPNNSSISIADSSTGAKIFNNLFYDSHKDGLSAYSIDATSQTDYEAGYNLGYSTACTTSCGWSTPFGSETTAIRNQNPNFSNYSTSYDLRSDSPAVNAGRYLTQVDDTDSGTGTTLIVDDAGYFQAGSDGMVDADWIAVGSVSNIVQISSIDYTTNTITLSSSINRSDGNNVWLYKDSDGTRVLYGSGPDIGAVELVESSDSNSTSDSSSSGGRSGGSGSSSGTSNNRYLLPNPALANALSTLPVKPSPILILKTSRELSRGAVGEDVYELQKFLAGKNIGLAAQKLLKNGFTKYFGPLTQAALAEYQKANNIIPSVGYFGPRTKAYMSTH